MPSSKNNPRSKNDQKPAAERGYVLLVFTLFAVLLVVAIYTILPKYVFEGQRQKEDELIFRGQQYARAIQLFVRKNGRYPISLDELQSSNQVRFLRQLYPDPMTKEGEWRLIHVTMGPAGPVFFDALNQPPQPTTGTGGNQGNRNSFQTGPGSGGGNAGGNGANSDANAAGNSAANNGSGGNNGSGAGSGSNTGAGGSGSQGSSSSQTFGSGGAIAGVASKDENEAIKVVNGYHHYNEWEFIFNYVNDPVAARKMGGGSAAAAGNAGGNAAGGNATGGNSNSGAAGGNGIFGPGGFGTGPSTGGAPRIAADPPR